MEVDMTVLAGMTVILVTIFFLVIILGMQIQINNVMKRLDAIMKQLDSVGR